MSDPLRPTNSIIINNGTGYDIPPWSVVVVTSVTVDVVTTPEGVSIHNVSQYSGQVGNVFVTGNATILNSNQGRAYSDQLIYVSIDQSVATPKVGEQWGPIPGQWYIGRGGMGFFCQGFDSTNGVASRAIFLRKDGYYMGKLTATLTAATYGSPTSTTFNVWHPDPGGSAPGQAMIVSPNSALLGLTAYNYSGSMSGSSGYDCVVQMLPTGLTFVSVGCAAS